MDGDNIKSSKLTDEQTDLLAKTIDKDISGKEQLLRDIQEGNIPQALLEEEEEATMEAEINAETGELLPSSDIFKLNPEDEDFFEKLDDKLKDVEDLNFTEEDIKKGAQTAGYFDDAPPEVLKQLYDLAKRMNAGEKIKYNDMPQEIKNKIMKTIMEHSDKTSSPYLSNKELKDQLAAEFIGNIALSVFKNKIQETNYDLASTIRNMMHKEYNRKVGHERNQMHKIFIEQFPEAAEQVRVDDPDKADQMLAMSEAYKESYNLTKMYNSYAHGKPKIKKIDIEKLHRLGTEFCQKYASSQWKIQDPTRLESVLHRAFPYVSDNAVKGFIALFIKYTAAMKPSSLADHTFMYYTIYNIASLDLYKGGEGLKEDEKEFYEKLMENIRRILELVETYTARF